MTANMNPQATIYRIGVVDCLRGFAVVGIILIHFLEMKGISNIYSVGRCPFSF